MDIQEFKKIVIESIENLPSVFKDKLDNIDIVVENEPDIYAIAKLKLGAKGRLLGLYQGVPLKNRTHYYGMVLPDKITLYKKNIERNCLVNKLDIKEQINHVLKHEIAHHFGISDKRLRDLDVY